MTLPTLSTNLPKISQQSSSLINGLTNSFGLPREVLASDRDIEQVLTSLPNLLTTLPPEKRNEGIARLCVACSVGLFDSAINYIWNETVRVLRAKLRNFGLGVIAQILEKDFAEKELNSIMDSQLLNLCLELNLISEDGFYFLDQCRDIRNNFSSAHPALGNVPPFEFLNFFDRCIKHAYDESLTRRGVKVDDLLKSLSNSTFTDEVVHYWVSAIKDTYDQQKSRIIEILHGIYCDDKKSPTERGNSLTLSMSVIEYIPEDGKSRIVDNHSKYLISSNNKTKIQASRWFFEKINLLNLLSESERHGMIVSICKSLYDVHLAMNNFYNEPPFAKRLQEISSITRPEISQNIFVEVVTSCAIGNEYNICFAASSYYEETIKTFSPREIGIFFDLVKTKGNRVYHRVKNYSNCRARFKHLVSLINASSVHPRYQPDYQFWMQS